MSKKSEYEENKILHKNRAEVVIDGKIVTLVSEESEEFLQRVARMVDKKTQELKSYKSRELLNDDIKSLYICINIADDYYKLKNEFEQYKLEHKQEMEELQEALAFAQNELDEYISTFDESKKRPESAKIVQFSAVS